MLEVMDVRRVEQLLNMLLPDEVKADGADKAICMLLAGQQVSKQHGSIVQDGGPALGSPPSTAAGQRTPASIS